MSFLQLRAQPPDIPPQQPATAAWAGTGATSFIGAALFLSVFSASGAGANTWTGQATTNAVLSAAGTSTPAFVGFGASQVAAAGVGTATFVGAATTNSVLSAAGAGAASWVGSSTSAGNAVLAVSDAAGTASFVGASTAASVLAAAGTSTPLFTAIGGVPLAAAGAGTASWSGASTAASVLSASGASTPQLVGAGSSLTTAGSGTAIFVGRSTAVSVLSASGVGGASWAFQIAAGALVTAGQSTAAFFSAPTFIPPVSPVPLPVVGPAPTISAPTTDLDLLGEIQLTLQEDATFSNGLWTLAEVVGYFNQRQYRFLAETKILAAFITLYWPPEIEQQPLPPDWIATIAATWHDYATGEIYPLPRTDYFELDHALGPTVAITTALPQGFREVDTTETLSIAVGPAPASPGSLGLLYVGLSEILDGTGKLFDIPDDWVPYIKYGVYADMLGKMGRGQDLLRARYAEQRYQEGIVLAKSLLEGWP